MPGPNVYDAIVIGGGHNGLVAAAYLARAGARVVVCEARAKTGGAAATDQPWPDHPEFRVTTLSYVMSLMPDTIVRDLQLARHGYRVHPVGPYVVPCPDGRVMIEYDDPSKNRDEFAKFSKKDADALERWEAWIGGLAAHHERRRPARSVLRVRAGQGRDGDRRPVRHLGRPARAGDGLRHGTRLDRRRRRRDPRLVGRPEAAWWQSRPRSSGAPAFGAEVRTDAAVEKVLISGGHARGVVLRERRGARRRPIVITACHPKITFLRQIDRHELPEAFVDDIEHWSSRSGVVKINCALAKLPTLAGEPDWTDFSGGFEIAPSIAQLERSFEEARAGQPATLPFSDGVIPTTLDPSLAPDGAHVVSLFTQWVPHTWSEEPHRDELEAYADRVVQAYDDAAPGFRESIVARQVIGPYDMETEWNLIGGNIFHGELSADQLFHMRPAPGYADYRTPIDGLYQCSSATHGGGGVSGIPAYNCVREIRRDRKRRRRRR